MWQNGHEIILRSGQKVRRSLIIRANEKQIYITIPLNRNVYTRFLPLARSRCLSYFIIVSPCVNAESLLYYTYVLIPIVIPSAVRANRLRSTTRGYNDGATENKFADKIYHIADSC